MSDPRSAVVYRIAAADLEPGDLVDTASNGNEWQEVLGVFKTPSDVKAAVALSKDDAAEDDDTAALRGLVEAADGRYVVVQLTDVAPVDAGVYFEDGVAMAAGEDDDQPMSDVIGGDAGVRTYVYTKYELVTVREHG